MSGAQTKPLLRALAGEILRRPPWWLMRQAGRYLPEYRELRSQAPDFVTFCLTPALAAEATLQPVRRFGMDAAILFADILLVPQALGQQLGFGDEGPLLEPIRDSSGVRNLRLDQLFACTEPVCETARLSRAKLPPETALIGFAGAPWTVATYMVEGGASKDFRHTKTWAYRDPEGFAALIELITEATINYLSGQIEAGVEVVQLFDSWAGVLPPAEFARKNGFHHCRSSASRAVPGCSMRPMLPTPASMRLGWTRWFRYLLRGTGCNSMSRCRVTSIRWCSWSAVRRWSGL
jgi:uroporphyrinogen decarboxylase